MNGTEDDPNRKDSMAKSAGKAAGKGLLQGAARKVGAVIATLILGGLGVWGVTSASDDDDDDDRPKTSQQQGDDD